MTELGSSACQRPGDLPALRVACRCSPVGFDRQQQRKALLIEGLEHDRLVHVLRREFLPVAAPPPGDLLLREEAALDDVLDVALLERVLVSLMLNLNRYSVRTQNSPV